jgi:hypothetical protein
LRILQPRRVYEKDVQPAVVAGNASLDVSYIGSAGHKLGLFVDPNGPTAVIRHPGFRGSRAPIEQFFPFRQWGSVSQGTFQADSIYRRLASV